MSHYVIRHLLHDGTELWWRPNSSGYTSELITAGVYGEAQAHCIENGRPEDTAITLAKALQGLEPRTVGDFLGATSYLETQARKHEGT